MAPGGLQPLHSKHLDPPPPKPLDLPPGSHFVTMPSTQTMQLRKQAVSVRGDTCLEPKLPSSPM